LLRAISDFLDDQKDMIEQVRCDLTRGLKKAGTGRNGLTPQQILRSLILMRIKNLPRIVRADCRRMHAAPR
jgi:IS5 family transposase